MAKVKLANLDPRAFLEVRGSIMLSDTKHGPVVSKWPKKRGKAKTGYDFYRQTEFGAIAKWAANPLDLDLGTAIEMAKGTEQVPRDILMMAMMGLYYVPIGPDGTTYEAARMTTNAQYILDQVTFDVGDMLWRAEIGWLGLKPGMPGQVLVSDGTRPYWGGAGPASGGVFAASNTWQNASTTNYASKGFVIKPLWPFTIIAVWGPVSEVAGQQYKWGLYEISGSNTILAVERLTPSWVAPTTQIIATPAFFTSPITVSPSKRYVMLHTRMSATNTTSSGLRGGDWDSRGLPLDQVNTYMHFAQTNPSIGQSASTTGANPPAHTILAQIG